MLLGDYVLNITGNSNGSSNTSLDGGTNQGGGGEGSNGPNGPNPDGSSKVSMVTETSQEGEQSKGFKGDDSNKSVEKEISTKDGSESFEGISDFTIDLRLSNVKANFTKLQEYYIRNINNPKKPKFKLENPKFGRDFSNYSQQFERIFRDIKNFRASEPYLRIGTDNYTRDQYISLIKRGEKFLDKLPAKYRYKPSKVVTTTRRFF